MAAVEEEAMISALAADCPRDRALGRAAWYADCRAVGDSPLRPLDDSGD